MGFLKKKKKRSSNLSLQKKKVGQAWAYRSFIKSSKITMGQSKWKVSWAKAPRLPSSCLSIELRGKGMLKDKILVADDEQSMREFLDIMLKKEGYKVSLAANGEEVVKFIEKDIFDLVLMDIRMPRLDGISTLKKIKAMSPETTVIMI